MDFINKIQKFMYGRYGIDNLTKFILSIYFILIISNILLKSYVLSMIELLLIFLAFYRTLSRKIVKRTAENLKFVNLKNSFKIKFKPKNTTDHIFKKCHHCRRILRLPIPSKKGIKHVKCPDCHKRNTFLILKCEKIEIINNNRVYK